MMARRLFARWDRFWADDDGREKAIQVRQTHAVVGRTVGRQIAIQRREVDRRDVVFHGFSNRFAEAACSCKLHTASHGYTTEAWPAPTRGSDLARRSATRLVRRPTRPDQRRSRHHCPILADLIEAGSTRYRFARTLIGPGFSNGAIMASALLRTRPRLLTGAILFRPLSPFTDDPPSRLDSISVLIIDGEKDSRRPSGDGARLAERLIRAGATVIGTHAQHPAAIVRRRHGARPGTFLTFSDRSETEGRVMLIDVLHGVQRIDEAIARKFGPAYNAILGIGLVIEIVRRLREFGDLPTASAVRSGLAMALFVLLLMHQLAELADHIDRRRHRARLIAVSASRRCRANVDRAMLRIGSPRAKQRSDTERGKRKRHRTDVGSR